MNDTLPAISSFRVAAGLVNALNDHFNGKFRLVEKDLTGDHFYVFEDADTGVKFYVSTQSYGQSRQGKVNVSVDLPNEWYRGGWPAVYENNEAVSRPVISMSVSKPVEAQARDFLKRLYEDGVKYWNLCKSYVEQQNNGKALTLKTKEALAQVRGKALDKWESSADRDELHLGEYRRCKVYGARVDLTLDNLNADQVKRIMNLLNGQKYDI